MARKGFEEVNTQVLGVSVDSVFSHKAYSTSFGTLWFPLLADFHPKGQVAESYGLMQPDRGFNKRAAFIIDKSGVVRHAEVYEPGKLPDTGQLLQKLKEL